MRRILLQEVHSIALYFRFFRPRRPEVERAPPDDRSGISYDEKFWNRASSHCFSTLFNNGGYISGLATDGDLTRPDQGGKTILAGSKRRTIGRHFLLGQSAENGSRQDSLNEDVLVKDHMLTFL